MLLVTLDASDSLGAQLAGYQMHLTHRRIVGRGANNMYTTITRQEFGAHPISNQFDSRDKARRFAKQQSRHELASRVEVYQGFADHPCLVYERGRVTVRAPYGSGKSAQYSR
jgi:hypothetical protein